MFRLYTAGDEFLVLLHGRLDPHRLAQAVVERLRTYGVSASVGLAYSSEIKYLPARAELRQAAERACQKAKKLGGNRALVVTAPAHAGQRSPSEGADARDNIPSPVTDEPMAGRIVAAVKPQTPTENAQF